MPTLSSAPGQAFATIADAVSAAAAGDTILLETGEYAEALELNTSTSLVIRPAEGNRGKVRIQYARCDVHRELFGGRWGSIAYVCAEIIGRL